VSAVSRAWQSALEVIIPHPSEPRVLAAAREARWGAPTRAAGADLVS
jgi:hypothetical protein